MEIRFFSLKFLPSKNVIFLTRLTSYVTLINLFGSLCFFSFLFVKRGHYIPVQSANNPERTIIKRQVLWSRISRGRPQPEQVVEGDGQWAHLYRRFLLAAQWLCIEYSLPSVSTHS